MLSHIALRGIQAHRKNVINQDRNHVVELLLHLENKQIMINKTLTQHKHVFVIY